MILFAGMAEGPTIQEKIEAKVRAADFNIALGVVMIALAFALIAGGLTYPLEFNLETFLTELQFGIDFGNLIPETVFAVACLGGFVVGLAAGWLIMSVLSRRWLPELQDHVQRQLLDHGLLLEVLHSEDNPENRWIRKTDPESGKLDLRFLQEQHWKWRETIDRLSALAQNYEENCRTRGLDAFPPDFFGTIPLKNAKLIILLTAILLGFC